jgi:Ca2+/Na+ antiporter
MLYILTIAAVLSTFYFENIKYGIADSVLLSLVMMVKLIITRKNRLGFRNIVLILAGLIAVVFLLTQHFKKNDSWSTFLADAKIAAQLDHMDYWKYVGAKGYPQNELGRQVSITNYERQTWAIVVMRFIGESPEGYGLVWKSFGYMAKDKWPDSTLTQSHSGWLDLTLGIGIPGVFLLILAGGLALKNAWRVARNAWGSIALWILLSIVLLMVTIEVSQKTYIDALVFLIFWAAGLGLHTHSHDITSNPT